MMLILLLTKKVKNLSLLGRGNDVPLQCISKN